jgi:TatA/E family protein of Tat protein translocase
VVVFGLENPVHLLFIVAVIALVFGSSRLPSIARSTGRRTRETREGIAAFKQEFEAGMGEDDQAPQELVDTLHAASPPERVRVPPGHKASE